MGVEAMCPDLGCVYEGCGFATGVGVGCGPKEGEGRLRDGHGFWAWTSFLHPALFLGGTWRSKAWRKQNGLHGVKRQGGLGGGGAFARAGSEPRGWAD